MFTSNRYSESKVSLCSEDSTVDQAVIQDACGDIELSIVMPCLNEAETIGICIDKAMAFLRENQVAGEVVIADNGSTDSSIEIAACKGARVVPVTQKGYGSALMGGINASRGAFVIMGDADDSYDFLNLNPFLAKLRIGYDLVMGNRFKGGIEQGAMPFLNRYLGNPVLSGLGKLFFPNPCGDFHCGLRGFRKTAIEGLDLRTTGMEFASEMLVKATIHKLKIAEVPTTLSPDGRSKPPHLRPWRDGWRHLRFLLMYSPRWLFLYPGIFMVLLGLAGSISLSQKQLLVFDIHTLLFMSVFIIVGFQSVSFSILTKQFAISEGLLLKTKGFTRISRYLSLEIGLTVSLVLILLGLFGSLRAFLLWRDSFYGPLEPSSFMRLVIPSTTSLVVGLQLMLSSFFLSILSLKRK